MLAIRESIPTEAIIKAYMDEGVEHDEQVFIEDIEEEPEEKKEETSTENNTDTINEETKEEKEEETIPEIVPAIQDLNQEEVTTKLTFNDMDSVLEDDNKVNEIEAPKTIERLEDISVTRNLQRKLEKKNLMKMMMMMSELPYLQNLSV